MSLFFTPDRPLDPPEEIIVRELPNCECCLEEAAYRTELGIYRLNLNPKSMVCETCLGELHQELNFNPTE